MASELRMKFIRRLTLSLRASRRGRWPSGRTALEEVALLGGYDLGRKALSDGLGVLEMATIHSRALAQMIDGRLSDGERAQLLDSQTAFFVEALSPFEMTHRASRDANAMLRRLNDVAGRSSETDRLSAS